MKSKLRTAISALAIVGVTISGAALADFPSDKAVTMIVPFGAGGGTDAAARVFAATFGEKLGQDVVPQNFTGTAGTVGTAQLVRARPDGYTIQFQTIGPITTQPHLRDLPYGKDDFRLICGVADATVVLMTTDATGYQSVDDVVAAARAEPEQLVYIGSPGTIPHIAMLAFEKQFDVKLKAIRGNTGDALKHINGGIAHLNAALMIPGMKPLAVFSDDGDSQNPGVPHVAEGMNYSIWMGIMAPKDTPEDIVNQLETACKATTEDATFIEQMAKLRRPIVYRNSADFRAFYEEQFEAIRQVIEASGLKLQ